MGHLPLGPGPSHTGGGGPCQTIWGGGPISSLPWVSVNSCSATDPYHSHAQCNALYCTIRRYRTSCGQFGQLRVWGGRYSRFTPLTFERAVLRLLSGNECTNRANAALGRSSWRHVIALAARWAPARTRPTDLIQRTFCLA